MKRVVALGTDHGGFSLKVDLMERLRQRYEVLDAGAHSYDSSDDYPEFVRPVVEAVTSGKAERGILICGSGVGACIAANKVPGINACACHDTYSAHQGVEHDDMNVLCLGARVIGIELAWEIAAAFMEAHFTREERHLRRLEKVKALEQQYRRSK